jgi:hypothetical protein
MEVTVFLEPTTGSLNHLKVNRVKASLDS